MVWKLIERPTKEWLGWVMRSRWQFLFPGPPLPLLVILPIRFYLGSSRQANSWVLWRQRHLQFLTACCFLKIESYIFIFLLCFMNSRTCGVSPLTGQPWESRFAHRPDQHHISPILVSEAEEEPVSVPPPEHLWSALVLRFYLGGKGGIALCMGKC